MNTAYLVRRLLCFCVLLVLVRPGLTLANDAHLTLDAAIELTLLNNPQLQQFMLKGKQLSADRDFAGLEPAYSIDMEIENFAGSGDFNAFDSADLTLALSSVIEMGGKKDARIQVADTRIDQFNLQREIQTIDLLSNLTQVFILTLSVIEKINLLEHSVSLHEELLSTVQSRVNKGIAQETDLMRAKSALVQEQLKLEGLQRKLAVNMYALSNFWGDRHQRFTTIAGDLYAFSPAQEFEALFAEVERSPAIQHYASIARLKQAEVQLVNTSSRSDLSWYVGVRQFQEMDDIAFVAGISIPLFSGERNHSSYQRAQYELAAVEISLEKMLLKLHQQLFEAYSKRQQAITAEQRIRLEVIPALEKSASLTLKGYERGRYTYQDVVSAQRELISAQLIRVEKATIALLNQSIIEQLIAKPLSE